MPPWIAAGMIIASVVAFLFVNRNQSEQQRQQHCHTDGCSFHNHEPREPNQNDVRQERYDTPPNFGQQTCDNREECPICLDPIYLEPQHTLRCGHRLHSKCYSEFRAQSDSCPICRNRL